MPISVTRAQQYHPEPWNLYNHLVLLLLLLPADLLSSPLEGHLRLACSPVRSCNSVAFAGGSCDNSAEGSPHEERGQGWTCSTCVALFTTAQINRGCKSLNKPKFCTIYIVHLCSSSPAFCFPAFGLKRAALHPLCDGSVAMLRDMEQTSHHHPTKTAMGTAATYVTKSCQMSKVSGRALLKREISRFGVLQNVSFCKATLPKRKKAVAPRTLTF
jgi:hypothetical protein